MIWAGIVNNQIVGSSLCPMGLRCVSNGMSTS